MIDPTLGWGDDPRIWLESAQVLGMPHQGTFAEYLAVPAGNVHPAPASLSDDEAAAIPLAGVTAYRALVTRGGCTKDDVVLLPGIGSGVQSFALLFAKKLGAKVIVTSSSDDKLARATALGADVAINYKTSAEVGEGGRRGRRRPEPDRRLGRRRDVRQGAQCRALRRAAW